MPLFRLNADMDFPPPHLAEDSGLLAIGGDLSPQRLIKAYSLGIFPWYAEDDPLLWWFTSPRLVLFPEELHIPQRLGRYWRKSSVKITSDLAFREVITRCRAVRTEKNEETWIHPELIQAYERLHQLGYAHSIECWQGEELVAGLYGVALDKVFFGESMYSGIPCGSQFALVALVKYLQKKRFQIIDCQMTTHHLLRFGAKEIQGQKFQHLIKRHIQTLAPQQKWTLSADRNTLQL